MAVDLETTRRDLEAMKEAGANFVRLCHYPHHPAELAMCDQIGLLVFAEVPLYFWNDASEGRRTNAARVQTAARQIEQMIARDFNHPSIEWPAGGHNPATFDLGRSADSWRTHLAALRRRYPTRPALVTEFGYCSFAGTHGHSIGEDEHSRVLEHEFAALNAPFVCGAAIWCWADHPWPVKSYRAHARSTYQPKPKVQ